jgi:hypothetical protein
MRDPFSFCGRYRGEKNNEEKGSSADLRKAESRSAEKSGIKQYSTIETNQ